MFLLFNPSSIICFITSPQVSFFSSPQVSKILDKNGTLTDMGALCHVCQIFAPGFSACLYFQVCLRTSTVGILWHWAVWKKKWSPADVYIYWYALQLRWMVSLCSVLPLFCSVLEQCRVTEHVNLYIFAFLSIHIFTFSNNLLFGWLLYLFVYCMIYEHCLSCSKLLWVALIMLLRFRASGVDMPPGDT